MKDLSNHHTWVGFSLLPSFKTSEPCVYLRDAAVVAGGCACSYKTNKRLLDLKY